jgi:hypothetical protein
MFIILQRKSQTGKAETDENEEITGSKRKGSD